MISCAIDEEADVETKYSLLLTYRLLILVVIGNWLCSVGIVRGEIQVCIFLCLLLDIILLLNWIYLLPEF